MMRTVRKTAQRVHQSESHYFVILFPLVDK